MKPKISVIIPNYNGERLLEKNLPKIIKYFPNCQIIISDDCSSDGSAELIKDKFKNVELTIHRKNKGFSSTVNDGAKLAKAEILVFLNTDVSLDKCYTAEIEKYFKNKNLFGIGFQDRSYEDGKIVLRGRGIGKFQNGLLNHSKGDNIFGPTLWISGGSCAVDAHKFRRLNGFNEIFNPFYWEDIDLSYRATKSGWEILFTPDIVVDHFHESGSIRKHHKPDRITQIAARNMFIFSAKNITNKKIMFEFYSNLTYLFLKSLVKLDKSTLMSIFRFLYKTPEIIISRHKESQIYKLSDTEVLRKFGQ